MANQSDTQAGRRPADDSPQAAVQQDDSQPLSTDESEPEDLVAAYDDEKLASPDVTYQG